ncbi:MAG: hypothetical protein JWO86_4124 [Myxococcaceae bacterium]|jgi:HSP20 family molecular chaperone IbpA|nr:hypothetical protein [Myxococcaceae bacterium]
MKTDLTTRDQESGALESGAANEAPVIRPRVDVFENAQEYLVIADVPGVTKAGLDVRFESGELRIEARRTRGELTGAQPLGEEYRIADYRRAFAMPDGIDVDKIEAALAHGVLQVHLPKSAAKRPRRIDIRAS